MDRRVRKSLMAQRLDMVRFFQYVANIRDCFLNRSPDREQARRVYFIFFISILVILTLVPFGVIALTKQNYTVGTADLTLALLLSINLLHARRYRNYDFNVRFGISLAALLLVYAFLTGGVNGTGFVCYYGFPLIACFFLGSKKGALSTALIFLPVVALFLIKNPPSIFAHYSSDFKLRFVFSFLVVSLFSYLFEYAREKHQEDLRRAQNDLEKQVEDRTLALREAIQSLQNEIIERRRAEAALEFTQFSVNCSADPIVWIRRDGRFIDLNEVFCCSVGYSREELLSMSVHDIDPNYPAEVWPEFWERLKRAGSLTYESCYRAKGGQVFPVEISSNFFEYKGKEYHCSFIRNITSRRHAEEGLRASEERYRTLVETVPDAIFSLSADGTVTSLNSAFEKITGWSRAEWIGKAFHTILHPDDRAHATAHFANGLLGKMSPIFEARVLSKSGRYITGEFIGTPHIKDGKVIEVIGFAREITDRKRAEETLKAKTQELARSNKDLEQFAYVASHDLQEPLRMVTSYVQLLARRYKGKLDSDADEFIRFAEEGAIRMWKLINDLLAYSRAGTQGNELEPTDCETALQQSLDNLKVTVEENEVLVTRDPLPTVMADHPQLVQLFQNLIGNAIKFRGNEPPRVHVSASRNGDGWIFSVRDNGIGIAPEYAKRIFIIFQRLHSRDKYDGTGIGLAICQKIVERHGGDIWVESELGKGATFYFTLPASKAQPLTFALSPGEFCTP